MRRLKLWIVRWLLSDILAKPVIVGGHLDGLPETRSANARLMDALANAFTLSRDAVSPPVNAHKSTL